MPDDEQQHETPANDSPITSTVETVATDQQNGLSQSNGHSHTDEQHADPDADPSFDSDRPNKRRKLTESLTESLTPQSRNSPRVPSPPWRKFSAEGPTTFLEGGKRRSGRTNALPYEMQPPSGHRRTRAKGQQTNAAVSNRYSSTPVKKAEAKSESSSRPTSKHARTASKTSQTSTSKSRRHSHFGRDSSPSTPTATMRKVNGKSSGTATNGRHSARQANRRTSSKPGANGHVRSEEEDVLSSALSETGDSDIVSSVDESMEDFVPGPNAKLQRVKFSMRDPKLPPFPPSYGNTLQFARDTRKQWSKRDFESLEEWTEWAIENGHQVFPGYDIYEGDDEYLREVVDDGEVRRQHRELSRKMRGPVVQYTAEDAREEAQRRREVDEALQPGGKLHSDTCTLSPPDKFELPRRQYAHWDHLLAHMKTFHKLHSREQRSHREIARRLAYAAQERWLAIQPKSQEEIDQEREETIHAVVTATFRQCLNDLTAKFDAFRAELDKVRLTRWQQEQEALGKKALNKAMERSAWLLDARRRRGSEMSGTEQPDEEDEDHEEDEDRTGSEGESSSDGDDEDEEEEENMSSSGSESEGGEREEAMNDEKLTDEELKKKYALLELQNLDRSLDKNTRDEDHEMADAEEDTPADAMEDELTPQKQAELEIAARRLARKLDDEGAEDSDESIDMSDEDSGGSVNMSDEDASDEDEEGEDHKTGLLGFFLSKKQLKDAKEAEDPGSPMVKNEEQTDAEDAETPADEPEAPKTNGFNQHFPMDDDEELEEVSLIPDSTMRETSVVPDAAQVQTPAASNDETGPEFHRVESHVEMPSKLSLVTSSSPQHTPVPDTPEPDTMERDDQESHAMELDNEEERQISAPATPVSSNGIKTPVPSLLRATLREYQHYGLDWLAGLYAKDTNGILADEMGLGKTIQTISLLAHLAEVHGVWGPHLVVVPTSVMLNWEVEFKKFLPGFKVLVYYGTPEERKAKRKGWMNDDKWNVVITSYQLVLQDAVSFKHRSWHYMVLDEAHNIKNWKSARWQTLLTFRTSHRLLLTGTPLQNNLTELWSLMFFLMPYSEDETGQPQFTGLEEFTAWFNKPVHQIMEQGRGELTGEARELVQRLHTILRPYLLRRLKADVEKQMPGKYEHVVYCKLSKRQRYLYDGFMSRASTRETLSSGNYLSIINCLMQLRKVCNHPDLFETRQIVTSFAMPESAVADYEIKEMLVRKRLLYEDDSEQLSLAATNLLPDLAGFVPKLKPPRKQRAGVLERFKALILKHHPDFASSLAFNGSTVRGTLDFMKESAHQRAAGFLNWQRDLQEMRSKEQALMDHGGVAFIRRKLSEAKTLNREHTLSVPVNDIKVLHQIERSHALPLSGRPERATQYARWLDYCTPALQEMTPSLQSRSMEMRPYIERFGCITPTVVAHGIDKLTIGKPGITAADQLRPVLTRSLKTQNDPFHESQTRLSIAFPDKRLLQYDCGKLQRLDALLRTLQAGGHRALIFTQMTKVLDILEQFLNIHGHRYLRLDGSTKIEQRQILTDRFNSDKRILAFILSSRSGGLGINLTGADTVIFYDLDWNPAMDKQCQDRAHRIGQTRDVHIYRFVSEYTIEANILRKANQKRLLDDVIIKDGDFTTAHFNKPNQQDIDEDDAMHEADEDANAAMDRILGGGPSGDNLSSKLLAHAEDKEDTQAAALAEKEGHADDADFAERSSGAPTRADTPRTPGQRHLTPHSNAQAATGEATDGDGTAEFFTGTVDPRTDAGEQVFGEKPGIGVDRYILEHLEWELKDVPIVPPEEKNKKKKGRKGEQYKRRR